jgi:hypothetical protein
MKSFKQFTEDSIKEFVSVFGRFNPPHLGHEKLINAVAKEGKGKTYRIYASQSEDSKKNPLSYEDKIKFMRKMFPQHGRNIILDRSIKNVFNVASAAHDDGFTKFTLVVGSDRVPEFKALLSKYDDVKGPHGYYKFRDGIHIVSAGERDPDADDVSGMSASKMRAAAADNDLETFSKGLPKTFGEVKELFNAVRKGMGLKESYSFRKHVQFEPINDIRERYIAGEIFNVGDRVYSKAEPEMILTVESRGPNNVACQLPNGEIKKYFITDLYILEGSSYYSGLSQSTADKREKHFDKNSKKDDNDDSAYTPAPGDKTAVTKPSKYTKEYKKRFDEGASPVAKALRKKSEDSGIDYGILKDVYDRGHAAWRTGHRPGTTPQQWGLARVNSFIVGGTTQKTTDSDLWKKHKSNK